MLIIRISGKIECDSGNREQLQVSWNRQFRNNLCVFIPKSMGFSQSKLRLPASTGILRETQISQFYRYHQVATKKCPNRFGDRDF
jgi:hypothetical protein